MTLSSSPWGPPPRPLITRITPQAVPSRPLPPTPAGEVSWRYRSWPKNIAFLAKARSRRWPKMICCCRSYYSLFVDTQVPTVGEAGGVLLNTACAPDSPLPMGRSQSMPVSHSSCTAPLSSSSLGYRPPVGFFGWGSYGRCGLWIYRARGRLAYSLSCYPTTTTSPPRGADFQISRPPTHRPITVGQIHVRPLCLAISTEQQARIDKVLRTGRGATPPSIYPEVDNNHPWPVSTPAINERHLSQRIAAPYSHF